MACSPVVTTAALIRTPDEITAEWLAPVLELPGLEVTGTERIGTGQMSQNHRVSFRDERGAGTVVVKLASDDATSRATGFGLGAYLREIAFYRNLAARIGGPVAHCHLAEYDAAEGWFTLVLEDVVGATQGDQIAGCGIADARLALRGLARIHAPVLGDLALGAADYLNQPNPLNQALLTQLLNGFLERYGERIAPDHAALCEQFVPRVDAWAADQRPPLGLVHGDYRLDNLLFGADGCTVVDWQTMSWGPAMLDASYFIGGALQLADRREHERELVGLYHETLLEHGVRGFSWEQCWDGYVRQTLYGILMTIAASMLVVRTERGDDMFMTWLARNAQQALDLGAIELLPDPAAGRPAPLVPDPEDEGRHAPGPEALWNESWYFDAVSDEHDLGLYVRLGRLPNQGVCLYTACVCGPGRPSLMLVDAAAPLPDADDDAQAIHIAGIDAEQHCEAAARALPGHGPRNRSSPCRPRCAAAGRGRSRRSRSRSIWSGRPTAFHTRGGSRRATRSRAECREPCGSATSKLCSRGPGSAITRGARATGGPSTGCGARCTSTTGRIPTRSASPRCPATASATSSAAAPCRRSTRSPPPRRLQTTA